MDLSKIRELLKIVAENDVAEVEIEEDDFKVVVRKNASSVVVQQPSYPPYPMPYAPAYPAPAAAPAPMPAPPPAAAPAPAAAPEPVAESGAAAEAAPSGQLVRAPIVGTFYRR